MLRTPAPLPSLLDDASEIDTPSEMLAADRTLTDLAPIPADEPSSVELSATDLLDDDDDDGDDDDGDDGDDGDDDDENGLLAETGEALALGAEPVGADGTGEIDAADILDVASALRTSRLPALAGPLATMRMPSSAAFTAAAGHPSSIAPLALDVMAPRASRASLSSWLPTPTTTQQIARSAGIPERSPRFVMIAASVVGMCLFAAIAGAALGYSRPSDQASAADPVAVHGSPRVAVVAAAHEEITLPPLTARAKDPSASGEAGEEVTPAISEIAAVHPAPPRARAATTPPAPRASTPAATTSSSSTGVIRVSPSISGVLVDGAPRRASGGAVTVSCGRHMVKAPGQSARLAIVPCGGQLSL